MTSIKVINAYTTIKSIGPAIGVCVHPDRKAFTFFVSATVSLATPNVKKKKEFVSVRASSNRLKNERHSLLAALVQPSKLATCTPQEDLGIVKLHHLPSIHHEHSVVVQNCLQAMCYRQDGMAG